MPSGARRAGSHLALGLLLLALVATPAGQGASPVAIAPDPHATPSLPVSPAAAPVGNWTEITRGNSTWPAAFEGSEALGYDAADGYEVSFGGDFEGSTNNQTWIFQRGNWTEIFPSPAPPRREDAVMTWDAKDGYLLLFGGYGGGYLSDTWSFLHGNWTQLSPSKSPPARENAVMTYDAADKYVVLTGGDGFYGCNIGECTDTWTFVGGSWTNVTKSPHPSGRSWAEMTYDSEDGYVLLFGGGTPYVGGSTNDTWKFKAGTWTQLHPTHAPTPEEGATLTDDPAFGAPLMIGGNNNSTWEWTSANWTDLTSRIPVTPPETSFGLVTTYDADLGFDFYVGNDGSAWGFDIPPMHLTLSDAPSTGLEVGRTVRFLAEPMNGSGSYTINWSGLPPGCAAYGASQFSCEPNASGSYTVSVTAGDWIFGGTESRTLDLDIAPALRANFSSTPDVAGNPLEVAFAADATGGVGTDSFAWAFGDGTEGTGSAPDHPYADPGVYEVTLWVNDSVGASVVNASLVHVETAPPPPLNATVFAGPSQVDAGGLIYLSLNATGGVGAYTFRWSGVPSTCPDPSSGVLVCWDAAPGNYTVKVELTDLAGDAAFANGSYDVAAPIGLTLGTVPGVAARTGTLEQVSLRAYPSGGFLPYNVTWSGTPTPTSVGPVEAQAELAAGTSGSATATLEDALGLGVMASVGYTAPFTTCHASPPQNNSTSKPPSKTSTNTTTPNATTVYENRSVAGSFTTAEWAGAIGVAALAAVAVALLARRGRPPPREGEPAAPGPPDDDSAPDGSVD